MLRTSRIRGRFAAVLVLILVGCAGAGLPTQTPNPSAPAIGTTSPTTPGGASDGLPPDGSWQVELSAEDLLAAGWPADVTAAGAYTWTFAGDRARINLHDEAGNSFDCDADMESLNTGFRLTYDAGICRNQVDDIAWSLDDEGLHLSLITTNVPMDQQTAYLETKPWQSIERGSVAGPWPSEPPWLDRCEFGCQGPITAGSFESVGFLPGLQMTFSDDAWFNTADYSDEIEFDTSDSALRFWQNPGASSETGELLDDVPRTVEGLITWFSSNPDMVVSDPEEITIGDGIVAKTFTLDVSDTNVNDDPGCPVRSCLNVLWINDGHVFGIGYHSGERLYLFSVGTGANARTVVVSLDTHRQLLGQETTKVDAILATLQMP